MERIEARVGIEVHLDAKSREINARAAPGAEVREAYSVP
jgi:hypothetical protein